MNRTQWELVNPAGVANAKLTLNLNPHPKTLDNKTVLLRWNGKPNGDVFLDTVGRRLKQTFKTARVIKNWEAAPETAASTQHPEKSQQFAEAFASFKPDIVVAAQGD